MQILSMILLFLFCGVTLIALFAALSLLIPVPVGRAQEKLEHSLGRSFLLGLVNMLFFLVLIGVCLYLAQSIGSGPLGAIPVFFAGLIAIGLAIFSLNGLVGMVRLLGTRMGKEKSPLMIDMKGGLLLVLAGLAPYIGWFIFTPVVLCAGLGATLQVLFQRQPKSVPTS